MAIVRYPRPAYLRAAVRATARTRPGLLR